ncbi:TonB-dependent receptor [Sphingomonas oleivorans]|uniref:TonB-dependent receptor n=1 Tax=Sphingomonas oleivorans TaxID=1735121 RepID=UPI0013FDADB7|nr:TonB-dependent receptor [Sphingomonas oleivorans]
MLRETSLIALLVGLSAGMGQPAFGQSVAPADAVASPTEAAPAEPEAAAQEIIVTGQRRSQRLQDVPASITAVSSEAINNSGFTRPEDLQRVAPSLSFNPSQGAGFQIRGVGSQGVDYNLEKAVATVVDDVVQGTPRNIGINTLSDIERVEVLRGPQGTLFGKNASGGVVFVVTQKPRLGETEVIGRYRYGSYDEILLDNTVNVPVAENLAFRATGIYQRRDGTSRNRFNGQRATGYRDYALKGKLLWEPVPDLEAYIIADYQNHRNTGLGYLNVHRRLVPYTGAANTIDLAQVLGGYGITPSSTTEQFAQDTHPFATVKSEGIQANISYHLGDYTLTSVTAYKHQKNYSQSDLDYTSLPIFSYNRNFLTADQISQEIRLNSPTGGFLDYVVGVYFFDLDVHAEERQGGTFFRTDLPPGTLLSPVGGVGNYRAKSRSYAAFGQANLHLTDQFTAILGGRYTHDRVFASFRTSADPNFTLLPQTVLFAPAALSDEQDDFSGKVTVQYEPSRSFMIYATASQGYKAPAIATIRGNVRKVEPETVTNYEIGVKSQLFDRALTLNVTAFTQKFKNFQTQTVTQFPDGSLSIVLANAGGLRSRGIEADSQLRLSRNFSLNGSVAYTPTKYTDFLTSCYAGQPLNPSPGPGCYIAPGTTTRVHQAAGKPLIYAPKYAYTVGGDYSVPLGDHSIDANVVYTWRSRTYTVAGDPFTIVPSYGLFNGNVSFGAEDDSWRVGLYFRNLFDKFYVARINRSVFAAPGTLVHTPAIDAHRTIGGQVSFRF